MTWRKLWADWWPEVILFVLFVLVNIAFLNRMPGLMGDEASEGENVYQVLNSHPLTVMGERSYIGPLIDYVRVPFFWMFGYNVLAVRVPMLAASVLLFVLAVIVLRRLFGRDAARLGLAAAMFSPVYLTYQRLGWAITLLPLFAVLVLWLIGLKDFKWRPLLIGLALGLGLHTHILFLPVAVTIVTLGLLSLLPHPKRLAQYWTVLVGLWAGFGTQAAVLLMFKEDQGEPLEVAQSFWQRLADLPHALPLYLSGASFMAAYTGRELSYLTALVVSLIIGALIIVGLVFSTRRKQILVALGGGIIMMAVLLVMIDRYSLRYFVVITLLAWVLAGVGLAALLQKILLPARLLSGAALGLAAALCLFFTLFVMVPFLQTGGSTANFSLGQRTDSASALVDVRPLISCLRGAGYVTSENVHIYNRLLFLSHRYDDLKIIDPEKKSAKVKWQVNYRTDTTIPSPQELCPSLSHFIVTPKSAAKQD